MAAIEITVTGANEIAEQLGDAAGKLVPAIDAAVDEGADLIWGMAITLVRVRTGNLKSTIHVEETGQMMERLVRAGGSQAPYAPFQEFGTPKMAPNPYMRPSADARRAEIVNLIAKSVLDLLKGI